LFELEALLAEEAAAAAEFEVDDAEVVLLI
jgi:hypothetical protein